MSGYLYYLRLVFVVFLLVLSGSGDVGLLAQSGPGSHTIKLKSGNVIAAPNAGYWLDSMQSFGASAEPVQVLIHFNSLPTKEQRQLLIQKGITLLDYLPENTFIANIKFPLEKEAIFDLPIHSFINSKPEWKSSSYMWKRVGSIKGAVEVLVSFYEQMDPLAIRLFVGSRGGQINAGPMEKYGAYKVIIDATKVSQLAQWYGVRCISPVTEMVPLDLESKPAVKGNVASASRINGGYNLKGDSVTVGVGDDCSGIYHADIKDRITNFNPFPMRSHGAHVNGIVGGSGNLDPFAEGMAPHVSLLDFLYDLILTSTGAMYHDYNMTITNNSYEVIAGDCDYSGTYDVYSRFLDTLSIQYPEVLHVFASGNDGYLDCSPYPQGFATVGGGYQPAKNNVVVGSMTDFYEEVADESRGPVKDGRLKPEIEATGLIAYSTILLDQYEWAAGTSMAAPHVAGGLALLTQRYKQLNGGVQPRADLMKAVLLNGGMDLGNPGPDYSHGFGEMDIYRSLQILDNGNYTSNNIANGDSQSFTITVPPNTGQLKVMLCWADVPASTTSSKQLVNDLDLTVKDPTSGLHIPLVLDPTPANVNKNATEQPDHLNNTEQVTIMNPATGTYTVKVKGYSIPYGPQRYVVTYDAMPKALHLTYPLGGEQLLSAGTPFDTVRVFWDAVTDGNTFKLEVSQDDGGSWFTINDHIPTWARYCGFMPIGLSTGKFRVRLSRNGTTETATSGRISFNAQPVLRLDSVQCPGYLNIHWSPVLNATSYYLYRKIGAYMQVVDSTADTTYSFRGLPTNANTYVAVQPVIDGAPGYRSLGLRAVANSGDCSRSVSAGDLMMDKIISPVSGRKFTSSQLHSSDTLKVQLLNLYTSACDSYQVSWKVNTSAWQTITSTQSIAGNGTRILNVSALDLSAIGAYTITAAIRNLRANDPLHTNDTLSVTINHVPNDTINLASAYFDGFESMGKVTAMHDTLGVAPNGHWDFFSASDSGRMRSFVNENITISGSRSISLDAYQSLRSGTKNSLVGTFNLQNFDTGSAEVRIDFDYVLHAKPWHTANNLVAARPNDTSAWNSIFTYDFSAFPGNLTHVHSLSLTDAYRQAHKNFSSSSQLSFGQSDTTLIAARDYGTGITLDNFRMYTVTNDVAMAGIVSPQPNNCGLPSPGSLTVKVHNGVNYTLRNIQLFYQLDGGAVMTGTLDSIRAKADVDFTFSQPISMTQGTTHVLNTWLKLAGDSYTVNDSLLKYHFRNSPIITAFPYLENFEQGDGGYYSDGYKNSWQFGTPVSPKINRAASGTKAWKTNLNGNYNNLELSYLYSPCFDLSGMTKPMLSFSAAMDIENCGNTLCDAGYIEVSYDGVNWSRLGTFGQGTNWYDSSFGVWNTIGFTRWHVASIPLPNPGAGYISHFRFVMTADPGVTFEGIALDDIHVFDLENSIYKTKSVSSDTRNISGNQQVNYTIDNQLLAAIQPDGQALNNTMVTQYNHDTLYNQGATQYILPVSYIIKSVQAPTDTVGLRLYLLESDVVKVLADTTCPSCSPVSDAYALGVTQYTDIKDGARENGKLADDTAGVFAYHMYKNVKWVPYDSGYYADIKTKSLGEYWFNDGGPTHNFAANNDYLNFTVYRKGAAVACLWQSLIDTAVNVYTVQWSLDPVHFATALDTPSQHRTVGIYSILDPINFNNHPVIYFRLRWTMTGSSKYYYSPIRAVYGDDSEVNRISFNAAMITHESVMASWTSLLDGFVKHYVLERAIGNNGYTSIADLPSLHHYGQAYNYNDKPSTFINNGTLFHYRLTAYMEDGGSVTLPERTVEWVNCNTFTNIYPNPSHDGQFTIQWFADAGTTMHLNITDAAGRSMHEVSIKATTWNNTTVIQTGYALKGVYLVRMEIEGRKYVAKMVFD